MKATKGRKDNLSLEQGCYLTSINFSLQSFIDVSKMVMPSFRRLKYDIHLLFYSSDMIDDTLHCKKEMRKMGQLRRTSHEWVAHRTCFSCTFSFRTGQLYLKSQASSAQRKSSCTENLTFHRGHFSVVISRPTLSIFHNERLRPIICSPLPSMARSSSNIGKRA